MNQLEIAKKLCVALRTLSSIPSVSIHDRGDSRMCLDSCDSAKQYIRQARRSIPQAVLDEATEQVDQEATLASDVIESGAAVIEVLGELADELRGDRDPEIGDEMETYLEALQDYDTSRKAK